MRHERSAYAPVYARKDGKKAEKRKKLTFAMGTVTATAPDCAHAVAWITPDTKVRLTLIPSSRCSLAAASIPDSVAGICLIFFVHGFKCAKSETPFKCVKFMAHSNH